MAQGASQQDLGFGWTNSAPVNGKAGNISHNSGKTDTKNFYNPQPVQGQNGAPVHATNSTGLNATAFGQTSSSAVIPGTNISPSNLALQVEKGSGGALPKTTLDSFVARSGFNDMIYGDEGTEGPPPYSSFSVIDSGGLQMTTGHKGGGLPSAWY